jgi:hypothetical protein
MARQEYHKLPDTGSSPVPATGTPKYMVVQVPGLIMLANLNQVPPGVGSSEVEQLNPYHTASPYRQCA